MSEQGNVERRLTELERKLDALLARSAAGEQTSEPQPAGRAPGHTGRVFAGILLLVLGLVWLGQNLHIEWLSGFRLWPVVLILLGLYLIFGGRYR